MAFSFPQPNLRSWRVVLAALTLFSAAAGATEISGSGPFILNDGPVYSNDGSYIGYGSSTYSSSVTYSGFTTVGAGTLLLGTGTNQPHTITVTADEHGTVSKTPDLPIYDYNTAVTVSAVPDEGYAFTSWTISYFVQTGSITSGVSVIFLNTSTTTAAASSSLSSPLTATTVNDAPYPFSSVSTNQTEQLYATADYTLVAHFAPISRIITLNNTGLTWTQQAVGDSSAGTFTITNDGNSPLTVSEIIYPAGFSGAWTGAIAPKEVKTITVTFSPTTTGTFSGDIQVHSDATGGIGTVAVNAVAAAAYTLEGVSAFTSSSPLFFISNVSISRRWEPGVIISPAPVISPATFTTLTAPYLQRFWRGSVVNVQAMPVSGYVFTNWTEKDKEISRTPVFDLTLVKNRKIQANYDELRRAVEIDDVTEFGARRVHSLTRKALRIRNYGNVPVHVTGLRFRARLGAKRSAFTGNWSGWIAPGASRRVAIKFKPNGRIKYRSNVSVIAENLTDEQLSSWVSGTGK